MSAPTAVDLATLAVLDRFLPHIAWALGVPIDRLPAYLDRQQIAAVAGLGSAGSLKSMACQGAAHKDPRWLAFRATIGLRKRRVPVAHVAMWLAVEAGQLQLAAATATATAGAGVAAAVTSLEGAFGIVQGMFEAGRRVVLCPDEG